MYAKAYAHWLLQQNFAELTKLNPDKRAHILKALSALAKFLGCHQEFKKLKDDYGLKWVGRSSDDLMIDRLTKDENPDEIYKWIKQVKGARPELSLFLDFMAISGLRLIEAVESYNLIIKLAGQKKLKDYYDAEKQSLEHYKFKEIFLRKTKKAFVSFISSAMVKRISEETPVTMETLRKRIQKANLPLRFSDIREAHGTFLTKYLKDTEVDFLEGRVASSVFMRNYFNPALITDLQARAFQGIQEIQEKVKA